MQIAGSKLDLKLNLSPLRVRQRLENSPSRSQTVSPSSTVSSCLSSEMIQELQRYSTSPEATSMMLVGCPRCLMYVMLSEEDPRCPKCKSTVLLDVINDTSCTVTATFHCSVFLLIPRKVLEKNIQLLFNNSSVWL